MLTVYAAVHGVCGAAVLFWFCLLWSPWVRQIWHWATQYYISMMMGSPEILDVIIQ